MWDILLEQSLLKGYGELADKVQLAVLPREFNALMVSDVVEVQDTLVVSPIPLAV